VLGVIIKGRFAYRALWVSLILVPGHSYSWSFIPDVFPSFLTQWAAIRPTPACNSRGLRVAGCGLRVAGLSV
jgi:hypothetical protein